MALPAWLIVLAIVALALALMASAYILGDILIRKRQMMAVMKWVWPLTRPQIGLALLQAAAFRLWDQAEHEDEGKDPDPGDGRRDGEQPWPSR